MLMINYRAKLMIIILVTDLDAAALESDIPALGEREDTKLVTCSVNTWEGERETWCMMGVPPAV